MPGTSKSYCRLHSGKGASKFSIPLLDRFPATKEGIKNYWRLPHVPSSQLAVQT